MDEPKDLLVTVRAIERAIADDTFPKEDQSADADRAAAATALAGLRERIVAQTG